MKVDNLHELVEWEEYTYSKWGDSSPVIDAPTDKESIVRLACQFAALQERVGELAVNYFKAKDPAGYNAHRGFSHGGWDDDEWSPDCITEMGPYTTTVRLSRNSHDWDSDHYSSDVQYHEVDIPTELIWEPDQAAILERAAEERRAAEEAAKKRAAEEKKRQEAQAAKQREDYERREFERLSKKYGKEPAK